MHSLRFSRKMITSVEIIFQIPGKLPHITCIILKLPSTFDLNGRTYQVTVDLEYQSKQVNFLIFLKEKSRTTYSPELTCQNKCKRILLHQCNFLKTGNQIKVFLCLSQIFTNEHSALFVCLFYFLIQGFSV